MLIPYLERIGLELPLAADAESLRRLQMAQLLHVPFENLDIALGRPIRLGLTTLYDKIVTRRRGGFCYELNGLFAWLLDDLGFEVTYLSASDYHPEDGSYGLDYDHLALLVRCPADPAPEVRWLVDVGWGDTFRIPLRADAEGEQYGGLKTYRITTNPGPTQGAASCGNGIPAGYGSGSMPSPPSRGPSPILSRCAATTRPRPNSIFTRKQICTLATADGRVSLEDERLIITRGGAREERRGGAGGKRQPAARAVWDRPGSPIGNKKFPCGCRGTKLAK